MVQLTENKRRRPFLIANFRGGSRSLVVRQKAADSLGMTILVGLSVAVGLEVDGGEGREAELDRIRPIDPGDRISLDASDVGARVIFGIGVEYLAIEAGPRNSHTVFLPNHRREVADRDDEILGVPGAAKGGTNARCRVVRVHPLEAGPLA